jgi:hypothetical protein
MLDDFNPQNLQDLETARQMMVILLNLVDEQKQEIRQLKEEMQNLRDEVNRLKGEQGKPKFKARKKKENADISSEKERKALEPKKPRVKQVKTAELEIDEEQYLQVGGKILPADAKFQGYESYVVQNIIPTRHNIYFRRACYYSPSENRSYLAPLPADVKGHFGVELRSFVISLYHSSGLSEPKIAELLEQFHIYISSGTISNILTQELDEWEAVADEVFKAGLASSSWQHIDDTGTRVDGVDHYCHILCNPFYTLYKTREHKSRLDVLAIFQNRDEALCLFDENAIKQLKKFDLPKWAIKQVAAWPQNKWLTQAKVLELFGTEMTSRLNNQQQARILEAGALSAYQEQDEMPLISILMSDDAPQFGQVTLKHALCWVHEGRRYKKLMPEVGYHRQILDNFLTDFWVLYADLRAYQADPKKAVAIELRQKFEALFSRETDYAALNKRLKMTKANQEKLLVVLDHPEIPLHNNPAELGARRRVRKRDVSFGPRTESEKQGWDIFMTLSETAKKLDVSFFDYVHDRVSRRFQLPSLADLIRQRSQPDPI